MATKLLLIEDVEDLGKSGEVVSVKPGFARNFLLPKCKAVVADKGTIRMQARLQEERQKQAIVDKKDAEALAARLEALTFSTVVKVDQEGHMFGSVSTLDIVKLLAEKDVEITKKMVQLKHPIKETGIHTIQFKLKEGVDATTTLKIVSDRAQSEADVSEVVQPITEQIEEKTE